MTIIVTATTLVENNNDLCDSLFDLTLIASTDGLDPAGREYVESRVTSLPSV